MEIMQVALVVISLLAVIQCLLWFRDKRYSIAILGFVYCFVYFFDLLYISSSGLLRLTISQGVGLVPQHSWVSAAGMAMAGWVFYSIGAFLLKPRHGSPRSRRVGSPKGRFLAFLIVSLVLDAMVWSAILRAGIEETLALRQHVFGESLGPLVGYYLSPVLAVFGIVLLAQCRGLLKLLVLIVSIVNVSTTALTGSRTGLFLTVFIPLLLLFWRRISLRPSGVGRDMKRLAVLVAVLLVPIVGGTWYLEQTRGVQEDYSSTVFDSVDVSQSDVLVSLIEREAAGTESTYLGSLVTFFPRAWWEDKPVPGNVVASEILAPERYATTGSEVTAGLLGEGFINLGSAGPIGAAAVLVCFSAFCDRLIRRNEEAYWILGVVLLTRGANLVRGDLANIVTPSVLAVIVWALIFLGRRGIARGERSRSVAPARSPI